MCSVGLRLGLRLQEAGGVPRATELVLGVAGMKRPTLLTGIPKVRLKRIRWKNIGKNFLRKC